jgi:hypothetical protein
MQPMQGWPRKTPETQKVEKTGSATERTEVAKAGLRIRPWSVFAIFLFFMAINSGILSVFISVIRGKSLEKINHHPQRDGEVLWGGVLGGVMTEAVAASDKQHGDRSERGHHHAVMAGPAYQCQGPALHRADASSELARQRRRTVYGAIVLGAPPGDLEPTLRASWPAKRPIWKSAARRAVSSA